MGFSLVIEAMINLKKPLIGHNCIYDWLYIYNQFIGELPETFADFTEEWSKYFPLTFDTKVLASQSKSFYNTTLGSMYERLTKEDKYKKSLRFKYDTANGFDAYAGSGLLSHYHEAAYDAHMTAVVFAQILK